MWHSNDICLSQWSVCRSSNYIFSVQKYAWIWYQKNTTHSYSSFCPPARRAENLNGCVSHVYSKFSADECRVRVSVCVVLYTQKKSTWQVKCPHANPRYTTGKSVVCRVSDSSPCAFLSDTVQRGVLPCITKKAHCKKSTRQIYALPCVFFWHTANSWLCHVLSIGTQQSHEFAVCFFLAWNTANS